MLLFQGFNKTSRMKLKKLTNIDFLPGCFEPYFVQNTSKYHIITQLLSKFYRYTINKIYFCTCYMIKLYY